MNTTTARLLLVQVLLVLGLGAVFLLPARWQTQPAGVSLTLPARVGYDWVGTDLPILDVEKKILSEDTLFARKQYVDKIGDRIAVSIVLSGQDMANSIHRPERCLAAQGWVLQPPQRARISLGEGQAPLEATRLVHSQPWPPTSPRFERRDLTYYWFVGSRARTASHLTRTLLDIKDRLLHGVSQRWAYVTVEAMITEHVPGAFPLRSQQDTAQLLEDFIPQVVPSFDRLPAPPAASAPSRVAGG